MRAGRGLYGRVKAGNMLRSAVLILVGVFLSGCERRQEETATAPLVKAREVPKGGDAPGPEGMDARYVLMQGTDPVNKEKPSLFRLDTWTGETWVYQRMEYANGNTEFAAWCRCEEPGGILMKMWPRGPKLPKE